ncbi:unnamed protein product [Anisakis simplex]|uniref:Uncharacterized protein n=1 Tax=Anisakis simplex TaxID=6269 RepID=A0A3P6SUB2_ANISI|nr:unnamed protein product [Anisakis simplex]
MKVVFAVNLSQIMSGSWFSGFEDFDEDLVMIPEIVDIATERFLHDECLSQLALEIRIEPQSMNRRRMTVRVAPKEEVFSKPGCNCEKMNLELKRQHNLHRAFDKVREHLVEMRPVNPYPTYARYSKKSFDEFGPTGRAPPMRSLSVDSATTAHQFEDIMQPSQASFSHQTLSEHVSDIVSHRSDQ